MRYIAILCGWLLFANTSFALMVNGLYDIVIPANNRDAVTRVTLLQNSFDQIIEKVVGKKINDQKIITARQHVDQYVSQYMYKKTANDDLALHVQFNPTMVNKLLKQAKIPFMSANRPLVIMWLAVETADDELLIGEAVDQEIVPQLQAIATAKGVPVVLPLLDLDDLNYVNFSQIANFATDVAVAAAKRYQADAVVLAKISQQDDMWHSKWQLSGHNESWDFASDNLPEQIGEVLENIMDKFVSKYAAGVNDNQDEPIYLRVSNIASFNDYTKINDYLRKMVMINNLKLHSLNATEVVFTLNADKYALQNAISLDQMLRETQSIDFNYDLDYTFNA